MSQKGFAPIGIILITIIALTIVGGSIWYWQDKKTETKELKEPTVSSINPISPKERKCDSEKCDTKDEVVDIIKPETEKTREVQLFYYNLKKDKEIAKWIPCSPDALLPVKRTIPITKTPIQDTIRLLLEGKLTEEEKSQGFQTEFPLPGLSLTGANLKNGVLFLEFADPNNSSSGGACRVNLIRHQIIKTAQQFPEVKEVKLPELLFQP